MPIHVGFVGTGGVTQWGHMPRLAKISGVRIAGLCDLNRQAAQAAAQKYGGNVYTNHRKMLAAESLDCVYVCVPPKAHGAIEIDVAQAGLPMFIEKPVALDLATARRIQSAMRKHRVEASVGYMFRYLDLVTKLKQLTSGRNVALFVARYFCPLIPHTWWRRRAESGGQTVEQVTHLYDLARYLAGSVAQVSAHGYYKVHRAVKPYDIDDATGASLQFTGGTLGTFAYSCTTAKEWQSSIELVGDGFRAAVDLNAKTMVWMESRLREFDARNDPYTEENRAFIQAVRTGDFSRVRSSYADAVKTLELTLAVNRSITSGKSVRLK